MKKLILAATTLLLFSSCSIVVNNSQSQIVSSNNESSTSTFNSVIEDNSSIQNSQTSLNNSTVSSINSVSNSIYNSTTSVSSSSSSISDINNSSSSEYISGVVTNKKLEKLYILGINDMHGKIEFDKGTNLNGASNIAYQVEKYRNKNSFDDTILIANGDMFQGQALSNLNHGESVINVMNAMNFDMMGIGNHEFDWGIEEVLRFFDNDPSNGEANFELVNSNIVDKRNNQYLEHTLPYVTLQKENIKVGIISAIGVDQKDSILAPRVENYEFLNVVASVGNTAKKLRTEEMCDIVICNIHDGGTYDLNTENNVGIANLKGDSKVDALINGHTHYHYQGSITRDDNSSPLPIVQAGSSSEYLGVIELTIDKDTKNVVSTYSHCDYLDSNYDVNIQNVVDNEYEKMKNEIEKVYCKSGETVTRTSTLRSWAGSCMQKVTDADIAFSNNGGLRNVNLVKNGNITVSDLYEINPFDNKILTCKVTGSKIHEFINNYSNSNYYTTKDGVTIENSNAIEYNVAVIDYLGFKSYFPLSSNYTDTGLIFRDVMGEDLKLRNAKNKTFCPSTDYKSVLSSLI